MSNIVENLWEHCDEILEEQDAQESLDIMGQINECINKLNIEETEKEELFSHVVSVSTLHEKMGFMKGFELARRLLLNK